MNFSVQYILLEDYKWNSQQRQNGVCSHNTCTFYWIVITNKKIYLTNKKVVTKAHLDLESDKEVPHYIINYMSSVKIDTVLKQAINVQFALRRRNNNIKCQQKKVKNNIHTKINPL